MHYRKLELSAKKSDRRFSKGTLCNILVESDYPSVVDFILGNRLISDELIVSDKSLAYCSHRNRVLAIPEADSVELLQEINLFNSTRSFTTEEQNILEKLENKVRYTVEQERMKEKKSRLIKFFENTLLIVALDRIPDPVDLLARSDVVIESIDLMGTPLGTLVPKSGLKDRNAEVLLK